MIDKIIGFMILVPEDKLRHSFWGTLIYLVLTLFIEEILSLALIGLIAVSREWTNKTGFSIMDIVYTIMFPILIFAIKVYKSL